MERDEYQHAVVVASDECKHFNKKMYIFRYDGGVYNKYLCRNPDFSAELLPVGAQLVAVVNKHGIIDEYQPTNS